MNTRMSQGLVPAIHFYEDRLDDELDGSRKL